MKRYLFITILLMSCFLLYGQFTAREVSRTGDIPDLISFQGRLTDNMGNPVNDNFSIIFSVYSSDLGGTPLWTEDRTVSVSDGLFQVNLGEDNPLSESYFIAQTRWLGVKIGTDAEMTPRIRITSAPYALNALETDPTWSGDADSTGDIGRTGNVGVGTAAPSVKLHINDGIFMTTGAFNSGPELPAAVTSPRMFFYPRKGAFRTGRVTETQWNDVSIGDYSTAMGFNTIASGVRSTAMGNTNTASGDYSIALGSNTSAIGSYATAMGVSTIAQGNRSTAMGNFSQANGLFSTAMGNYTVADGGYSTAMGSQTIASGDYSTAMGRSARAVGNSSFAVNLSSTVGPEVPANTFQISGATKTVISEGNVGIGIDSPIEKLHIDEGILLTKGTYNWGPQLTVGGSGSRMFFYPRKAAFRAGYVDGEHWDNENIGIYSTAMGRNTIASGDYSNAIGYVSTASGMFSTVIGTGNTASGDYSIALGGYTTASEYYATALGYGSTANGNYSTAMGYDTIASGVYSTSMGFDTTAGGYASTSMGELTTAEGYASTAMGYETIASGSYSTAMGRGSTANNDYSIATGFYSTASGLLSNAMGYGTTASGNYSIASGYTTIAGGTSSIAMGRQTQATGDYSFGINLNDTWGPVVAERNFRISGALQIGGNLPWTNHSDRRLKKDIYNLQEEDNLAKILRLNGVRFRWNDHDKNLNLGFIAQDVEDIVPESVRYDEINDIYSMEYTALIPVLVEAIKEQQKQIDELQQIIRDLKENLDK